MVFVPCFVNIPKNKSCLIQGGGLDFRSRCLNKNLLRTLINGRTSIDVNFYHKWQVVVQHNKLSYLAESEKMKSYWKAKLERGDQFTMKCFLLGTLITVFIPISESLFILPNALAE
jgi:hypothetical protein